METTRQTIKNKNAGKENDKTHATKQTPANSDIDENVNREEEYDEVNKNMMKEEEDKQYR